MQTFKASKTLLAGTLLTISSAIAGPTSVHVVQLLRTPNAGIQPQVHIDSSDRVHLIYYRGNPAGGDLFYVCSEPGGTNFSRPIPVNRAPGTAIAAGSIRGAQFSLGRNDRVHVVWNGANALPGRPYEGVPLYYTRLDNSGQTFEPERDLLHTAGVLDGGVSVAADSHGRVVVLWHGAEANQPPGETNRAVFQSVSTDDGNSFSVEQPLSGVPRGVCPCCSLRAFAAGDGSLALFYRSARTSTNRDGELLLASASGEPFQSVTRFPWTVSACPMSSASFAAAKDRIFVAGESSNRVWFATVDPRSRAVSPLRFPNTDAPGKHPGIASSTDGTVLLAWAEGAGWARGGRLAWQLFDAAGKSMDAAASNPAIPTWSFPAVAARRDGTFLVIF